MPERRSRRSGMLAEADIPPLMPPPGLNGGVSALPPDLPTERLAPASAIDASMAGAATPRIEARKRSAQVPARTLEGRLERRQTEDGAITESAGLSGAGDPGAWPEIPRNTGTVWFDHTDLAHYFEHNRTPTGIQRVEIELYRAGRRRLHAADGPRAGACAFDMERRFWVMLPRETFDLLCGVTLDGADEGGHAESADGLDEATWTEAVAALQAAIAQAPPVPFRRHDVLVTVGASWWIADYLVYVRHLQQQRGVLYAPFVHDCIPVLVPETCAAGLVVEFGDWFAAAMHAADLTFANSSCTARDVVACATEARLPVPAPHVVPLDAHAGVAHLSQGPESARRDVTLTHAKLGVRRRFALFVATIEARKDHIFVFRCWQDLIARYGAENVPDLLCVGKSGWLVEFTLNWLQVHPELADRIRLLGTLTDEDLAGLYATAEFCVYNSQYEGWGLPVTESLCHGRVPLVPHHSSLPEAGGSFAVYFEPGSPESFIAQATRLLDPGSRAGLERQIRARYRPRTWAAIMDQIMTTAARAPIRARPLASGIPLEQGGIYTFARRTPKSPTTRAANGRVLLPGALARFGTGWWRPEEWGCWSRAPQAHLLFSLAGARSAAEESGALAHGDGGSAERRHHTIYVLLRGGPAPQRVEVAAGGLRIGPITLPPHRREMVRIPFNDVVASNGDVLIALSAEPYSLADHTDGRDPRLIGFGLEALAVIDINDVIARLNMNEMATMPM